MTAAVKYTEDQVAALKAGVADGVTAEVLAEQMGKSTRSVVAKLAQLGLYKAKEGETKVARKTKAELVAEMADLIGVETAQLESLEKAKSETIAAILAAIRDLRSAE